MVPASWSPPTTILLLPRNSWVSGIRKDADGRWGKVGDYEFRFYENIGRAGVWKMRSGERESYGKLGPNGVKMVCEAKKGGMGDWVARWRRGPLGDGRDARHREAQKEAQRTGKAPVRKTHLGGRQDVAGESWGSPEIQWLRSHDGSNRLRWGKVLGSFA